MYKIVMMSDNEFDSLPYPEMSTSLGVADPSISTAYVRKTGMKALDIHNAMHELEHLEEGHEGKHADHYRNGVYYKGFGEIFEAVGPMLLNLLPQPFGAFASAGAEAGVQGRRRRRQEKQSNSQMEQMQQFGGGGGSPMDDFSMDQGEPNVIQAGQSGGVGGIGGSDQTGGGSIIDRLKGFYSGRDPIGA